MNQSANGVKKSEEALFKSSDNSIGFKTRDLVKIVAKFLNDMGYTSSASQLQLESGLSFESTEVSYMLEALSQQDWGYFYDQVNKVNFVVNRYEVKLVVSEFVFAGLLRDDKIKEAVQYLRTELSTNLSRSSLHKVKKR